MKKSAASFLLPLLLVTAQADDWPWLLGPTGDNVSKETGLIDEFPKPRLGNGPGLVLQALREIGNGVEVDREVRRDPRRLVGIDLPGLVAVFETLPQIDTLLLADNRHVTFYVWRHLLGRHRAVRYAYRHMDSNPGLIYAASPLTSHRHLLS